MRAGLERDIHGRVHEEGRIGHRGYGVDLGMAFTAPTVPSLTDDTTIGRDYHRSNHRVGGRIEQPVTGKPERTTHVNFVDLHINHSDY